MTAYTHYFFCGIGGSGMLPLAVFLKRKGAVVSGSDRAYDQGRTPEKFKALVDAGIPLYPQDGTGVSADVDCLVVSSAVEPRIPDVQAAQDYALPIQTRGQILATLFNAAPHSIAVAGTSGKSTVTGMIASMLAGLGNDPQVVNGGEIVNFRTSRGDRFASIRCGAGKDFVAEMDESDGSIAHYDPHIAVLNNIALDHKTMDELNALFGAYLCRAKNAIVVNADNANIGTLLDTLKSQGQVADKTIISYTLDAQKYDTATLYAHALAPRVDGIDFIVTYGGQSYDVSLSVGGRYNVSNALAALSVAVAKGIDLGVAVQGLQDFRGIHRRMEMIGKTAHNVSVIDDFAHNPDKISASLESLKAFNGRLLIIFQAHGFGPLRLMGNELVAAFSAYLGADDIVFMPEVYYAGGTVDRSVTAKDIVNRLQEQGVQANWFKNRAMVKGAVLDITHPNDRIVIMGARDDTLHLFAHDIFATLNAA